MKKLFTLGMAAAMIATACAAYAYPTFLGPTGLIQAPTAQVVPAGQIDIAADYFASKNDEIGAKNSIPIRALFGVGGCLEIGGTYVPKGIDGTYDFSSDSLAGNATNLWNINAKYKTPCSFAGVDTAVGVLYGQANTDPNSKIAQAYLVGTDKLCIANLPIALTLGVNWTEIKQGDFKADGIRAQAGVAAIVYKGLDLVADYQTKNKLARGLDYNNLWSAGVRYAVLPQLSVEAGATNGLLVSDSSKAKFFVGANCAFGLSE